MSHLDTEPGLTLFDPRSEGGAMTTAKDPCFRLGARQPGKAASKEKLRERSQSYGKGAPGWGNGMCKGPGKGPGKWRWRGWV